MEYDLKPTGESTDIGVWRVRNVVVLFAPVFNGVPVVPPRQVSRRFFLFLRNENPNAKRTSFPVRIDRMPNEANGDRSRECLVYRRGYQKWKKRRPRLNVAVACFSSATTLQKIVKSWCVSITRVLPSSSRTYVSRNEINRIYLGSETRRRCILGNTSTRSYPASWCSGRTRRTAGTCIRSRLLTKTTTRAVNIIISITTPVRPSVKRRTRSRRSGVPGPHTCLALGTNIRRIRRCSDTMSRDRRRSDRAFLLWPRNRLRKKIDKKTYCQKQFVHFVSTTGRTYDCCYAWLT